MAVTDAIKLMTPVYKCRAVPRPGLSSETPDIEEAIQRHLFPILILALLSDGCSTAQNRHVSVKRCLTVSNAWRGSL